MSVDLTKIKKGDKITVELIVGDASVAQQYVQAGPELNTMRHHIASDNIVGHTPKPLEVVVGTKFRSTASQPVEYTVVTIHGDRAAYTWVTANGALNAGICTISTIRHWMENISRNQDTN